MWPHGAKVTQPPYHLRWGRVTTSFLCAALTGLYAASASHSFVVVVAMRSVAHSHPLMYMWPPVHHVRDSHRPFCIHVSLFQCPSVMPLCCVLIATVGDVCVRQFIDGFEIRCITRCQFTFENLHSRCVVYCAAVRAAVWLRSGRAVLGSVAVTVICRGPQFVLGLTLMISVGFSACSALE